jgi:hypothetical protein
MWIRQEPNPAGGSMESVWARRYTSAGWSEPARLDDPAYVGHVQDLSPRVAFDGAGNAIAIWTERMPPVNGVARYAVWTRRWSNGVWSDAAMLAESPRRYWRMQLAVNAGGDAIVAWESVLGEVSRVGVRTFTTAAGWAEERQMLGGGDGLEVVMPEVAIAPSGDAVVVWMEHGYESPSPPRVWSAWFR